MEGERLGLLQAIARMEGFYKANSRAARNNNPGNIEAGKFATAHGARGRDRRFACFPDVATGFAAMRALFQSAYRGLTLAQALTRWAPPKENDTARYITLVCEWTGLNAEDVIDSHLG